MGWFIDWLIEWLIDWQDAKEYGKERDYAWQDTLLAANLGCWSDICQRVDAWEQEERVRELERLIAYLIDDMTKVRRPW